MDQLRKGLVSERVFVTRFCIAQFLNAILQKCLSDCFKI